LIPLSDAVIYAHLAGDHTIGVYPLLEDDTCYFLAIDFDEAEWKEDVRAFAGSCTDLGVSVAIETSRSGNGAHAWIFFANRVLARDARRLGTALISYTCARTRQLKLASYDRLFPNQDSMPKGGFGNLIALLRISVIVTGHFGIVTGASGIVTGEAHWGGLRGWQYRFGVSSRCLRSPFSLRRRGAVGAAIRL